MILGKFSLSGMSLKIPFGINHSINIFNPGFVFVISGLLVVLFWEISARRLSDDGVRRDKAEKFVFKTAGFSLKQSSGPFLVIIAMSGMVQLMINSGSNFSGLPSLIATVAKVFETRWLPFLAPLAGAFGSFLTGSATISNLLFGDFLSQAAAALSMSSPIILSLILVGGAAGNMIALADMLAAETVVGLKHKERELLKRIFLPCLIYVILAGIIGMIII